MNGHELRIHSPPPNYKYLTQFRCPPSGEETLRQLPSKLIALLYLYPATLPKLPLYILAFPIWRLSIL